MLGSKLGWWAGGAVALLVASGLLFDWLRPAPKPVTTEQVSKLEQELAQQRTLNETITRDAETQRAILATQQAALRSTEDRLANVNTQTHETTYRGDALTIAALLRGQQGPSPAAPAPIINVLPSQPAPGTVTRPGANPAPLVPAAPGVSTPIEIVVRDTRVEDTSKTKKTATVDTTGSVKTDTHSATKVVDTKAEKENTTEKVSSTVSTKSTTAGAGSDPEGDRIGVGLTSDAKPFASYDVTKLPLGPRIFGLGKLNAGLFVTGTNQSNIDGGPQVNIQKNRMFVMGGFAVKERKTLVGIGWKF